MRVVVLLLSMWLALPVFAAQIEEDPLERRVLDISKDLRCAVCQNQPISESNAPLARDMREIIREQLQAGKSRDEIMQYFVERYGNYVLMKPPVHGPGTVLWIFPLVIGAILAVSAFFYLKHRRRDSLPPAPTLSKQDVELVRQAREQGKS
ncbi:MAG TPA: cytochrome c-type biogenesis protein [Burkholderiales bacterium]|nr:cytochrome c-type biogenesis protein [Burkholderiales bacterium]